MTNYCLKVGALSPEQIHVELLHVHCVSGDYAFMQSMQCYEKTKEIPHKKVALNKI